MSGRDNSYLDDDAILHPADAAAAILIAPGERYVLQLRDDKRGIFFPGHWGCFGGAVDPADGSAETCLIRELKEELGLLLSPGEAAYFSNFTFDLSFCGVGVIFRTFYEVHLSERQLADLCLGEGSAFRSFSASEALSSIRLVPYDAFGLWMHFSQHRLTPLEH